MVTRTATCPCGQLNVECGGEPVRISVCHCLNCKKRSGSAFAAQARWADDNVKIIGQAKTWRQTGDSGKTATFRFCPECGATVLFENEDMPGVIAVAIGAFADPTFPPPLYSVYEERKHPWVSVIGDDIEHYD